MWKLCFGEKENIQTKGKQMLYGYWNEKTDMGISRKINVGATAISIKKNSFYSLAG